MMGFLGEAYPWVKAFHIIFVIFWMAGLFLLPRFLVYHQEAGVNAPEAAVWIERETKLRRIILTPSMAMVWILGLSLAANIGLFDGQPGLGWLHTKMLIVILLSGYHGWATGYAKKLARGTVSVSNKTLRMLNEVPGLAVILIVILVVVRPF